MFVLSISTVLLFNSCLLITHLGYSHDFKMRKNLLQNIENEPNVSSARIVFAWAGGNLWIEIIFVDGGLLQVDGVNDKGGGQICSFILDGYYCMISKKNDRKGINHEVEMKFWSALIGIELKNIYDIIRNIQAIREHIESWTNLLEYRNDNESVSDAINRLFEENLVTGNFITFAGEEYFVCKHQNIENMDTQR